MIKTFTGPMFSGKSTKLIDKYLSIWNKENVICFKPSKDTRDKSFLRSRNFKEKIPAFVIKDLSDIESHITDNIKTIFIDEIQFCTGDVSLLVQLSMSGIDIYIAGLSVTSELKPFGIMPNVLAISNEIEICSAVCFNCNHDAYYTFCKLDKSSDELIGNIEYIPLCSDCYKLYQKRKED